MNTNVLGAVFKRNFVSYFANPTGYVFICVFVLLSAFAAFWPNEFFNANLANLDQLNHVFPFIMLVFIPAITMAVWADERRQGTDELLLTIPADDFDIVLGKYLAAVAIYSVSLLFSLVCNYLVLNRLASSDTGLALAPAIDVGLFLGTYAGYWVIGLAMLAVGMVASFLTSNLTVSYILGAVFNAPLVFLAEADVIFGPEAALSIKQWSISEQFHDFGQGVISLAGVVYFVMIVVIMIYLSVVLIGRRHWRGSSEATMPAAVFYPLVHLMWLASFATFWFALKDLAAGPNLLTALATVYLLLQTVLLLGWSLFPREVTLEQRHWLMPLSHLVALATFVICAAILRRYDVQYVTTAAGQQPALTIAAYVLIGLFAVYLLLHAALFWGWFRFPNRAALMPGQCTIRALALVVLAVGVNVACGIYDQRLDVTGERLSSLSPQTVKLLAKLELTRPVQIEAFISPAVPESYVQARLNLLAMLRELQARGGEKVKVRINHTERFSEEAARAEQRFGITSRQVTTFSRGALSVDHLFMGVAFNCGLEKVILPFIDRGIPVEYELVRSICTVSQQKRKKIGILQTDAQLYGQFNFQSMSSGGNWPIIDELEKQYQVVQADPANPITEKYDVLLAVQPSSLGPEQMQYFVDAIKRGQPTAIFEDPMPIFTGDVPGTSAPRQPPGGMNPMMMMGGRQQGQPKGDIEQLWRLLGVDFSADQVIWQDYNPYPKATQFPREFVFVDEGCGAKEPFNEADQISSRLQHMLFPFPGAITKLQASALQFTPLVRTGDKTGTVRYSEILQMSPFGPRGGLNERRRLLPTSDSYVLAAQIRGKIKSPQPMADEGDKPASETPQAPAAGTPGAAGGDQSAPPAGEKSAAPAPGASEAPAAGTPAAEQQKEPAAKETAEKEKEKQQPQESEINVVVVADIDMLSRDFFRLREQGEIPEAGIRFDFDNVTFVLNTLDTLAGDERFLEIRKRRPQHRTLTRIEQQTDNAKRKATKAREDFIKEYEDGEAREQRAFNEKIEELKKRKDIDPQQMLIEVALAQRDGQRRLEATTEQLRQKRDKEVTKIETQLSLEIRRVQDRYKMWAVLLPPIPPLGVALAVFFTRRSREREGVSRARLR